MSAEVGVADGHTVGLAVGAIDGPLLLDGCTVGIVVGAKKLSDIVKFPEQSISE